MKKVLARLERVLVRVAVSPELRPVEHDLAVSLARSVALRVGASSAVVGLVVELINKYVA